MIVYLYYRLLRLAKMDNKIKKIIRVAGGIAAGIVTIGGTVATALVNVRESNDKYSNKWFDSLSDDELSIEREIIRQRHCQGEDMYDLLHKFDDVMSKRAWGNEVPHAPAYHSEHGWYLSEDD